MNKQNYKDLPLQKKKRLHIIFAFFCMVFTVIFNFLILGKISVNFLINGFIIMFIEFEILFFLGQRILEFGKNHTRRELTTIYLSRLLVFYFSAVIICMSVYIIVYIFNHYIQGSGFPDFTQPEKLGSVIWVGKITAIGCLLIIPANFFIQWQRALKSEYKLKEQNLIFQNETLKNQVNPHFLFNSLNTLSSLVNTQTEVAEIFIGRLSSIYRYILENSPKDKVPLTDELAFIKDYFFLHKIRGEEKIHLMISLNENIKSYEILPVSLQMLIENAIKHNMVTRENPLNIEIIVDNDHVIVKNNLQKKATNIKSTETGLKNLRERVRLITGKELIIEETKTEYIVKVPLVT